MLCCVSRKASSSSARPNGKKREKAADDTRCSGSSSGFSESSSSAASSSSGDSASSGFSAVASSASSAGSTSGFSSASPTSRGAFGAASTSSDSSYSCGSDFCNRFDDVTAAADYSLGRTSTAPPQFIARRVAVSSSSAPSAKGSPPAPPKRLQSFSPASTIAQSRSNTGNGDSLVENEKSAEDEPPVLLPCAICARTFMPQSLEKHTRICERAAAKKRKPFDSAKQRIQGTDLAEFLPKETTRRKVQQQQHQQEEKPLAASKAAWKQTHDEFLRAVRAARGAEAVESPPQRQVQVGAGHVTVGVPTRPNEKGMCPTCNRQFSIKAYERHVAWCKEHATRVPISPAATNIAKERLEARMRYRAPLLKNRRPTNREKYSPGSAINLPSYAGKTSPANARPKESASTPNCHNKLGNGEIAAASGGGAQTHQKPATSATNAGRPGQGREGISSTRPMKSRLSDRSSRPSAEIDSESTKNPSSTCPVPPPINLYQHSRLLLTSAVTAAATPTGNSPLSTSRSANKSESGRTTSQDYGNYRRISENDRRGIELNIVDGAKHHQRLNIVSARSHGRPKVNDVAINDDIIGMTVQRCGLRGKSEKKTDEALITWKQISEETNLIHRPQLLRSNDDRNLEQSVRNITLAESKQLVDNELSACLRSGLDSRIFATSGVKKLNQTYLLRESLDPEKIFSGISSGKCGPVVNSPRIESCRVASTMEKNYSIDFNSDATSPSRFDTVVNVTSSPLKTRREGEKRISDDFCGATSPGLSGLAPLNLEMIRNDANTDQSDTWRSEVSTASSLKPITRRNVTYGNSPNLRVSEEGNSESKSIDIEHSFVGRLEDSNLDADSDEYNESRDTWRTAESTPNETDDRNESLLEQPPKVKSRSGKRRVDVTSQLSRRFCEVENTSGSGSIHRDEGIESIDVSCNNEEIRNEKPTSGKELKNNESLDLNIYNEDKGRPESSSKMIEDNGKIMNTEENHVSCDLGEIIRDNKPTNRKELKNDESLDLTIYNEDNVRPENSSETIIEDNEKTMSTEVNKECSESADKLFKSTMHTSRAESFESLNKIITNVNSAEGTAVTCDKSVSEYSKEDNSPSMTSMDNRRAFRDVNSSINCCCDEIVESLDTPRLVGSETITMKNSYGSSLIKGTSKLLIKAQLSRRNSSNDSCGEKNDECSNNRCELEAFESRKVEKPFGKMLENRSSDVEKSQDISREDNSLAGDDWRNEKMEKNNPKLKTVGEPKNYQRCGTYVIDRSPNPNRCSKHSMSDEFVDEKPLAKKRRRIQQQRDMANIEIEKNVVETLETNDTLTNFRVGPSDSLVNSPEEFEPAIGKIDRDTEEIREKYVNRNFHFRSEDTAIGKIDRDTVEIREKYVNRNFHFRSEDTAIGKIDRDTDEIHEKYVNQNFDYNSDNTGDLFKDNDDTEASIGTGEKLSSIEISNDNSQRKSLSDSVVAVRTSLSISCPKIQEERVARDPEIQKERVAHDPSKIIRRKLKKTMSRLRSSTDTLISSLEASVDAIGKTSSIVASREIEKTTPQVEKETIRELNFATIEKTIAASRTTRCGFLPEIPIDRTAAAKRSFDAKAKQFPRLDSTGFSEKTKRNSCTSKLINLDPPMCRETRVANFANLPPVVPAAFRKKRPRGSFKDYDPFLLAERQMNELLSDTCSDQSLTDSPANRRRSSSPPFTNYPLSHSSAFVKYPDLATRNSRNNPEKRASLIAPPSEFDDPTGDFSSDSTETNSISREMLADLRGDDGRSRENGFGGREVKGRESRDHVLGRRVIIDKSKALGATDVVDESTRKNSQSNEKARKILDKITPKAARPRVTRSSSVRANSAPKLPERNNDNSSSLLTSNDKMNSRSSPGSGLNNRNNNNNNNNYATLSGSNASLSSVVSSEVEVKRSNSLYDELASSFEDDASGTFPSLRSLLKNDSLSVSSPVQSDRPRNGRISDEELSSPDSYRRKDHNKLSADSAYSSLNRKYSNHGRSTNDMAGRPDGDSPQRRRDGDASSTCSAKSKMSKFCHECGCKFPEVAKFCCECGIRRLAL